MGIIQSAEKFTKLPEDMISDIKGDKVINVEINNYCIHKVK